MVNLLSTDVYNYSGKYGTNNDSNSSIIIVLVKKEFLLPPLPVFSMRYWYMCNVNSMCEFLCSSSVVLGCWLLWRAAMAASRNQAAFSGVGARSSD